MAEGLTRNTIANSKEVMTVGSSLKDKLTGNCESCKERRDKIIKAWRKTVDRINAAFEKRQKEKGNK